MVAVLRAWPGYDRSRGAAPATFIYLAAWRHLCTYGRHLARRRRGEINPITLDCTDDDGERIVQPVAPPAAVESEAPEHLPDWLSYVHALARRSYAPARRPSKNMTREQ